MNSRHLTYHLENEKLIIGGSASRLVGRVHVFFEYNSLSILKCNLTKAT